jgi:hypothetical protein
MRGHAIALHSQPVAAGGLVDTFVAEVPRGTLTDLNPLNNIAFKGRSRSRTHLRGRD